MKIYVASSWRNPQQDFIVEILKDEGYEVYDFKNPGENKKGFSWSDVDPEWEKWTRGQYKSALQDPVSQAGFKNDFDAMQWADVCVMVMPCGRSAHTEAGWMKGAGKPTIVLQLSDAEPELMYLLFDEICLSTAELRQVLKKKYANVFK